MENIVVSIWVRTLSIFIVRIIVGRPFTVKIHPTKANRISGDMPSNNHRDGSLWRFSLYGTQAGRVGAFSKLISPQFVRPFVKSNKNDFVDAEAICEAASRPSMRFVQPRTESQRAMRALHRVRESGSG